MSLSEAARVGAPSRDDLKSSLSDLIKSRVGALVGEGMPMLKLVHDGSDSNANGVTALGSSLG
jgi:hypothetical protein